MADRRKGAPGKLFPVGTQRKAAYLAGKGVERDVVEALHWLRRAEANGAGELAAGFLKEAQAHAKPSQRAEAERRAGEPLS